MKVDYRVTNIIQRFGEEEVYKDLSYIETKGVWKDGVPEWASDISDIYYPDNFNLTVVLKDAIKYFASKFQSNLWIPVAERTPDLDTGNVVYHETGQSVRVLVKVKYYTVSKDSPVTITFGRYSAPLRGWNVEGVTGLIDDKSTLKVLSWKEVK